MHLRILPDNQNHVLNKDIFWKSVVVKNAFWCIFAYFQTTRKMFWKKIFLNVWSGSKRVLGHFRILPDHQNHKIFLNVWSGSKRVLMHLRILPEHQNHVLKKVIFERLELFKTCFDALAHTSRPPKTFFQKRCFWTSEVVKNVFWCIFAYFQTTRKMFWKKIFLTVCSG